MMPDFEKKYSAVIEKCTGILFTVFLGAKVSHSDVVEKAELFLPTLIKEPNPQSLPDYSRILQRIVDRYEEEVGINTYEPYVLAQDRKSKYWLFQMKPNIPHSFFDRYKLYLSQEGFPQKAILNIESTCETILAYCANPSLIGVVDKKKGLVVGDVQSGKTANYLGLINMAFDYGYRIVVLLAGATNSLRLQTQKRTDSGVIGAKSDSIGNTIEYIGVGFGPQDHFAIPFTNQTNDFKKFIQKNLNATISDFKKPIVLVVKKHTGILNSVIEQLQAEATKRNVDPTSILIIDDEADYASVNTKSSTNPSAVNRCIRQIFNKFSIASYVGYTATPFANVFINPNDSPEDVDLFPSDFIVQLNAPDTYFGGRKIFPHRSQENDDELPRCLRLIFEDEPGFLPVLHKKNTEFPGLTDSMKEAIHSFLINSVIRTIRGQITAHRTMMINITRFNDIQTDIQTCVEAYIERLSTEIEQLSSYSVQEFIANSDMQAIYSLYTDDPFYSLIRMGDTEKGIAPIEWSAIQDGLYSEIQKVKVVEINSKNGKMTVKNQSGKNKRFDYEDYASDGARVIAIGGMVLSRGLTLEGLMISYYSRNAGAYDTLLQMCRWFGYRPKYEDLCRIYVTQENIDRFDAVLTAVEDLRMQFAEMERRGLTPKQFGLMVREAPEALDTTLLITDRNKMKGTEVIEHRLNYGGVYADTSKLSKKPEDNSHNLEQVRLFMERIPFSWTNNRFIAQQVPQAIIAELIRSLKIPYINKKFDIDGLSEYIADSKIFPVWDVVIATGKKTASVFLEDLLEDHFDDQKLTEVERSFHIKGKSDLFIRIGGSNNRVMEPSILNAGLWLTEEQKQLILMEKKAKAKESGEDEPKNLSALDYLERRACPILIIYPIRLKMPNEAKNQPEETTAEMQRIQAAFQEPLMAFAVGFPKKESEERLKYRANKVKLDQLVGAIEVNDEEEGVDDDEE